MENKVHPFEPVYEASAEILILGSLPSVASTKRGFYYMHPQNRFWRILEKIYDEPVYSYSITLKKEFLYRHHLALFDVVKSCSIHKSSDQSICNVEINSLEDILNKTKIRKIVLNGKKAYELFVKEYPKYRTISVLLPSTSSANASYSLERLIKQWEKELVEI